MSNLPSTLGQCVSLLREGRATEAQAVASVSLRIGLITCGDYIALARWSEGRPSYIDEEYGVR